MKSKETSSQLKPVRNSCVAIMHQPVTVSSNMQPNACTNKAFSRTSTRFNPYFAWCYCLYILYRIKSCRCARESLICTCIWLHVWANSYWPVHYNHTAISNWLLISLFFIAIPLLHFTNSNFSVLYNGGTVFGDAG